MSSLSISFLVWLPILAAFWVGVVALGRSGQGGPWWSMLAGLVLATLGFVGNALWMVAGVTRLLGREGLEPGAEGWMMVMFGLSGVTNLGWLLFAVGFVLHALGIRRTRQRVAELEGIIAAQQEQISRSGGT